MNRWGAAELFQNKKIYCLLPVVSSGDQQWLISDWPTAGDI